MYTHTPIPTQHPMYLNQANTCFFAGMGPYGPFYYESGTFFGPPTKAEMQPISGPRYGPEPAPLPYFPQGMPFMPGFGIGPGFF